MKTYFTKSILVKCHVLVLSILVCTTGARAMNLDWSGDYRFEFAEISQPNLAGGGAKSYLLHHMVLRPNIIAADGVKIHVRLDLLNNAAYPNSQLGSFMGEGPGTSTPTDSTDSNVLTQSEKANNVVINELYLDWYDEFSSLIVGRAPLNFGLGITYNSGKNPFDHWLDNRDMIAYRMTSGNFTYIPVLARVSETTTKSEDSITDYIFFLNYENVDLGLAMGIAYKTRVSPEPGNDAPTTTLNGTRTGGWNSQDINIYVARKYTQVNYGVEAGFLTGSTGLTDATNGDIRLDSFAVIGEIGYKPTESRWSYNTKLGYVSGDNPNTSNHEGYLVDRNYDVAFLLFNHPLGQLDFLGTKLNRNASGQAVTRVDDEVISNATYLSQSFNWQWKEKTALLTRLTYALLNQTMPDKDMANDLGFEFDFGLSYKPYDKFHWLTEVGLLLPGKAFAAGKDGLETRMAYGITTKIAISF